MPTVRASKVQQLIKAWDGLLLVSTASVLRSQQTHAIFLVMTAWSMLLRTATTPSEGWLHLFGTWRIKQLRFSYRAMLGTFRATSAGLKDGKRPFALLLSAAGVQATGPYCL